MRLAERELQRQYKRERRISNWKQIKRNPFKYLWMRCIVGSIVSVADGYREWVRERTISKLLAYELGIPIELAYALGQDTTGKCYLETKKKLIYKGRKWTERPIQITKTLNNFKLEQEEKEWLNARE